ncbi:hypothetical protein ACFL2V_02340 [Pseudomonadota bacterium]
MKLNSLILGLAACSSVATSSAAVGEVVLPYAFSKGQAARASEVNGNFEALAGAVNGNAAQIEGANTRITALEQNNALPRIILGTANEQVREATRSEFSDMDSLQLPPGNWKVSFEFTLEKEAPAAHGQCQLVSAGNIQDNTLHADFLNAATTKQVALSTFVTGATTVYLQCKKTDDRYFRVTTSSANAIEVGAFLRADPNGISTRNTPQ